MRACRVGLGKFLDDFLAGIASFTAGMSEPTAAGAVLNIEYKIIAGSGRHSHRYGIQGQRVTRFPGDYVIGTRSVSAYSERADYLSLFVVKRESSAEDDHSSNRLSE